MLPATGLLQKARRKGPQERGTAMPFASLSASGSKQGAPAQLNAARNSSQHEAADHPNVSGPEAAKTPQAQASNQRAEEGSAAPASQLDTRESAKRPTK